jgi:hypothetical protein
MYDVATLRLKRPYAHNNIGIISASGNRGLENRTAQML